MSIAFTYLPFIQVINSLKFDTWTGALISGGDDGGCKIWDMSCVLRDHINDSPLLKMLIEERRQLRLREIKGGTKNGNTSGIPNHEDINKDLRREEIDYALDLAGERKDLIEDLRQQDTICPPVSKDKEIEKANQAEAMMNDGTISSADVGTAASFVASTSSSSSLSTSKEESSQPARFIAPSLVF